MVAVMHNKLLKSEKSCHEIRQSKTKIK